MATIIGPLRIEVPELTPEQIAELECRIAASRDEWCPVITPERSDIARIRNACIFGFSLSACLWLIIGGIVWACAR